MRLAAKYRVEAVASKDTTRQHTCQPHLDVEKKRLVATNGHALASVPVEVDARDRSGLVPVPAVREARKKQPLLQYDFASKSHKPAPHKVVARKGLAVCESAMYRRDQYAKFPPYEMVIPKVRPGDKGTITFGINPALLMQLAAALGVSSKHHFVALTVSLPDKDKPMLDPIVVTLPACMDDKDAIGVVMPARVDR